MSLFEPSESMWRDRMLSMLRIVVALLFIEHGTQKMFNLPVAARPMDYHLVSLIGLAGVLEACGGFALLIGLFTRPVAFLLAGEMAVAYFKAHFVRGFFPVNNGGEPAVLFCFIYLYLAFAGGGVWSVDYAIAASRARTRAKVQPVREPSPRGHGHGHPQPG